MGFNIIEGDVNITPKALDATQTLAAVDTNGDTAILDMTSSKGKLISLMCIHTAGASTLFTVSVYDNSLATDQYLVYEAETTVVSNKLHLNTEMIGFNNSVNNNLYVKVTPATGTGHAFTIRLQAEKSN
jgi:hypothetical protein